MEVFLDDKLVDDAFVNNVTTVEEALRHVQANLCALNQMVVGLRCNGQEVPADKMAKMLQEPAKSFARLEVVTGTKDELVTDAMSEASTCLAETERACRRVAELLEERNTVEAAQTLAECLRVWQQVHEAVGKSIEMLQVDPQHIMVGDESLIQLLEKPKEVLLQIRSALQVKDYVLLADILQYEFSAVTDCWRAIIGQLRREAEGLKASRKI